MKKKIYFLVDSENFTVNASEKEFSGFDDAHYRQVEVELDFREDFEEYKDYYLGRLLNRTIDQVDLA
jgi:hypothetical protein